MDGVPKYYNPILDRLRKQIKWIIQQLQCLQEKGCLCYALETDLTYDETTRILSSTYIDGTIQQAPLNIPRRTSQMINDGENGVDPFITLGEVPLAPEYTLSPVTSNTVNLLRNGVIVSTLDLTPYLDDTNLARIVSGTVNNVTGVATFQRDDTSTFTVDFSALQGQINLDATPTDGSTANAVTSDGVNEALQNIDSYALLNSINGNKLQNGTVGLAKLNDVNVPTTGQILSFNGTGLEWIDPPSITPVSVPFTPIVIDSAGVKTINQNVQSSSMNRVGNIVFYSATISVTSIAGPLSSGGFRVRNFPLDMAAAVNEFYPVALNILSTNTPTYSIYGRLGRPVTEPVILFNKQSALDDQYETFGIEDLTNGFVIISGWYVTNQ